MRLTYHVTENVSCGEVQRVAGREGEGSSGMQDTVKLPAESPIPRGVGGRRNGLCPLRALGPLSRRVFVLSPCLWDPTLLFGTAPGSSRYHAAGSFRRVSYFKRPRPGARLRSDLSAVLPVPRSSLIKVRLDTREIRLNFAPTTLDNVKFELFGRAMELSFS